MLNKKKTGDDRWIISGQYATFCQSWRRHWTSPKVDISRCDAKQLGVSENRWCSYIEMMEDVAYIKGAVIKRDIYLNDPVKMVYRSTVMQKRNQYRRKRKKKCKVYWERCNGGIKSRDKKSYNIVANREKDEKKIWTR